MTKIIQFSCPKEYLVSKSFFPEPIKINIPEWFKKLKHNNEHLTIKGCVPFLDTLTTGYLLKIPQDIEVKFNVDIEKYGEKNTFTKFSYDEIVDRVEDVNLNVNHRNKKNAHPTFQLLGSPFLEQNKNNPVLKIISPWTIKTPPGYSCLFLPPLNNKDDRFEILSGIVDTDSFVSEVNFPCIFNGYKYESLETTIKAGTPYVQVIPFKKESWKMIIKEKNENTTLKLMSVFINKYKNFFWNKISWN
jgi:hypothetical protein